MNNINGGILMLMEIISKLPPSEKKIAQYIIDNPTEIINCNVNEISQKSLGSSAAVMRLCKKLGLKGFQELKLRVYGDLNKNEEVEFRDIVANEAKKSVINKITTNNIQAIKETTEIINIDELDKAVDFLIKARRIVFYGVGASGIIAEDAQQKFTRINKQAYAFTDMHTATMTIANLNEEDVVFLISFSGETKEVLKILKIAKQKNIRIISLTKYGINSISSKSDIKLYSSASRETIFRSAATSSRLAQLHMIDILFMCLVSIKYDESINFLDETRKYIRVLENL
jgi:DNA-binding MurR/RpiR family transcriptional regulator